MREVGRRVRAENRREIAGEEVVDVVVEVRERRPRQVVVGTVPASAFDGASALRRRQIARSCAADLVAASEGEVLRPGLLAARKAVAFPWALVAFPVAVCVVFLSMVLGARIWGAGERVDATAPTRAIRAAEWSTDRKLAWFSLAASTADTWDQVTLFMWAMTEREDRACAKAATKAILPSVDSKGRIKPNVMMARQFLEAIGQDAVENAIRRDAPAMDVDADELLGRLREVLGE